MTKTISLADDAYEALTSVKREGESFSELARRLAHDVARRDLFNTSLGWDMDDEQATSFKEQLRAWRDDPRNERRA